MCLPSRYLNSPVTGWMNQKTWKHVSEAFQRSFCSSDGWCWRNFHPEDQWAEPSSLRLLSPCVPHRNMQRRINIQWPCSVINLGVFNLPLSHVFAFELETFGPAAVDKGHELQSSIFSVTDLLKPFDDCIPLFKCSQFIRTVFCNLQKLWVVELFTGLGTHTYTQYTLIRHE